MSQENVEIVRRAFDAYARGGVEAMIEYATPDCVFYPDPSWVEEQEYRGRDAFVAQNAEVGDLATETAQHRHQHEAVGIEQLRGRTRLARRGQFVAGRELRRASGCLKAQSSSGPTTQVRPTRRLRSCSSAVMSTLRVRSATATYSMS